MENTDIKIPNDEKEDRPRSRTETHMVTKRYVSKNNGCDVTTDVITEYVFPHQIL